MNLNIVSGVVRLTVNDEPNRVIEINVNDVNLINRYFALMDNVEAKEAEYTAKIEEIYKDDTVNSFGVPNAMRKEADLSLEICTFMREQIDETFGKGTSQTVFGDVNHVYMFNEFFNGISPHIAAARRKAAEKYTKTKSGALK